MVKHKMEVDAVDVAFTFGVEEKCSPCEILSSFLEELKESLKQKKWKSHGSHAVVNEANKRELSTMKSVIECLEAHNIDPTKLIPRFRISDRIMSLEEKIARNDRRREKMVQNRKFDETGFARRFEERQAKRIRILGSEHQRAVDEFSKQRPLPAGGTAGHIYGYSVSPSVLPGPVAGPIPDIVTSSLAASRRGMTMDGVSSGITTGTNNNLQAGSYTGFHGRMPIEDETGHIRSYNHQLYGWQGNAFMHERAVSHNYGYRSSPPWQGSMGLPNPVPVGRGNQTAASYPYQLASTVPRSVPYQHSGSYAVGNIKNRSRVLKCQVKGAEQAAQGTGVYKVVCASVRLRRQNMPAQGTGVCSEVQSLALSLVSRGKSARIEPRSARHCTTVAFIFISQAF
ncbi:putative NADPH-dependent codeinone reductase 1-4-like [Capsicum annuum]|nr:putative NADPH-dependent codeinone reductase 1-4-like [Capsicum annuum]KAF3666470.1 putative NADPH-dependent codeinone reductase 1-4-like [Capsicum annuum]